MRAPISTGFWPVLAKTGSQRRVGRLTGYRNPGRVCLSLHDFAGEYSPALTTSNTVVLPWNRLSPVPLRPSMQTSPSKVRVPVHRTLGRSP